MHLIQVSCLPSGCELVTHHRLPTDQTPEHLALIQQPRWCASTQLPSVRPHFPAPLQLDMAVYWALARETEQKGRVSSRSVL